MGRIVIGILVTLFVVIGACIVFLVVITEKEYHIVDSIISHKGPRTTVFAFVEVKNLDTIAMMKIGDEFLEKHHSPNKFTIAVVHFYRIQDTASLTDEAKITIQNQFPKLAPNVSKLRYVPNGYLYRAFSGDVFGVNLPKKTLQKTSIYIPKKGVLARDIMKDF